MLKYQQALARAYNAQKKSTEESTSIPQELLKIHPKELIKEMPDIFQNAQNMQKQVLAEIINKGADSDYGRTHNFSALASIEDWQNKVPLSNYDDYLPYIQANLKEDKAQLFNASTELYVATTGSTGEIKYFPESSAGNAAKYLVMLIRGMYMAPLLPVTLDMEAKNLTISNYSAVGQTPAGKLIVRASGQTARNMRQKTGTMNILPIEFLELPLSAAQRDYISAVYALADRRMAKIFCNNLAHFERLYKLIVSHGSQMLEDIRRGSFSVELSQNYQDILKPGFLPNPQRADELEQIYQANGGQFTFEAACIGKIWPNLEMVGCWLSSSVGRDALAVLKKLPPVKCIDLGYGASEGKFNIPTKLACPSGAAAPFALFYEFAPLDGGKTLFMWEVQNGSHYRLIITTYSGLYRYDLQDIVKIDGFTGAAPNIEFCCKAHEYIRLKERIIYAYQLVDIIREAEIKLNISCDLLQVLKEEEGFSFVIQGLAGEELDQLKKLAAQICREKLNILPKKWYLMDDGYKMQLFNLRTRSDRGTCGIKLPIIVENILTEHIISADE